MRRSVANHLNDIARDHPALVVGWCCATCPTPAPERRALLKHASRTLIKQGDARMLKAWGLGRRFAGTATLGLQPKKIRVGDSLALTLALHSSAKARAEARHRLRRAPASRPTASAVRKVFKGWAIRLAAGESRTLAKQHSMRNRDDAALPSPADTHIDLRASTARSSRKPSSISDEA